MRLFRDPRIIMDTFKRKTASTASFEKYSLSWESTFEERVVFAIFIKSSLKASVFFELSIAEAVNASNAACDARR